MLKKLDNAHRKANIVCSSRSEKLNDQDCLEKQVVTDADIRDILRVLQK